MILSDEVKQKIINILDSKEFMSDLYEGLTDTKREELGQFYTPAALCIRMLEKYNTNSLADSIILDPTCGSGNLLIAALIAGANVFNLYGNDYDVIAVDLCRKRINRACDILGLPHIRTWQIHQGNAFHEFALTYFDEDYDELYNAKGYKRINHKNVFNLDNENYDAFETTLFRKAHPDLYNQIEAIRAQQNLKETANALDSSIAEFMKTFGGDE